MGELTSRQTTALRRILLRYRVIFGLVSTLVATVLVGGTMLLAAPTDPLPPEATLASAGLAGGLAYVVWRMLWRHLLQRFPGLVQIFDLVDR